jgi:hypothetical protein
MNKMEFLTAFNSAAGAYKAETGGGFVECVFFPTVNTSFSLA